MEFFVVKSNIVAWKGSQYASDNIKKILKMNKKKKSQPQNAQHRELASLLFRVPKHKLLSLCTVFLEEKISWENDPQKPKNFKKILRKCPASNAWAAILKNPDVS